MPFSFLHVLGEIPFATPETVITYTDNGFSDLTIDLHRAMTDHLIRSVWKDRKRPVLVNNWEATYFDFT